MYCSFVERRLNRRETLDGKLYVKHFSEEIDGEKLREMFEPYGKIISAKVIFTCSSFLFKTCYKVIFPPPPPPGWMGLLYSRFSPIVGFLLDVLGSDFIHRCMEYQLVSKFKSKFCTSQGCKNLHKYSTRACRLIVLYIDNVNLLT